MASIDTDLRCYLTNVGIGAENNAIQLGRKLPIKEMVFGSGVLADNEDPRNQTAMIAEQVKVPCAMIWDEASPTLLTFKADLPVDVGGFHIGEVAIRLEDGTLYGYARGTGDYKPTPEQGATESVRYVVEMYTTNATVIECKVDLSSLYVDYEDLKKSEDRSAELLSKHLNNQDPHSQYATTEELAGAIKSFGDEQFKLMVGIALPMLDENEREGWVDGKGGELSRTVDKLLWDYAVGADMVVSQARKDAEPYENAMKFGDGNGSTTFTVPNYHLGHFVRGTPTGAVHGQTQGDAIRNLSGTVLLRDNTLPNSVRGFAGHEGVFTSNENLLSVHGVGSKSIGGGVYPDQKSDVILDASLMVPTAEENRPYTANMAVKICRGWKQ